MFLILKIMIKYFITLFGLLYPQLFQLFSIQPQQNNKNFFYFHRFHHFHDFQHEKSQTYPGMVPYKRAAGDKSSIPLYQHNTTGNYQQIMHMQQPFVPVSCEYSTNVWALRFVSIFRTKLSLVSSSDHK